MEPITGGVPQAGQPHIGTPVNMGFGQPPLSGPQLGESLYPQGHSNQPGLMDQQALELEVRPSISPCCSKSQWQYQMQNLQLNGRQGQTPVTHGVPSSNSTSSPPPMVNQRSAMSVLFPPDFMQHIVPNSLDDFETNIFPMETDINLERDFRWLFHDDYVPPEMR